MVPLGDRVLPRLFLWVGVFGWVAAVGIGWVVDHFTAGRVPLAVFPIAWLGILMLMLVRLRKDRDRDGPLL